MWSRYGVYDSVCASLGGNDFLTSVEELSSSVKSFSPINTSSFPNYFSWPTTPNEVKTHSFIVDLHLSKISGIFFQDWLGKNNGFFVMEYLIRKQKLILYD